MEDMNMNKLVRELANRFQKHSTMLATDYSVEAVRRVIYLTTNSTCLKFTKEVFDVLIQFCNEQGLWFVVTGKDEIIIME